MNFLSRFAASAHKPLCSFTKLQFSSFLVRPICTLCSYLDSFSEYFQKKDEL